MRGARLACVKPAASVRSEPGSNSHVENSIIGIYVTSLNRRELHTHPGSINHPERQSITARVPWVQRTRERHPRHQNDVTSLDKRDRQSLFQRQVSLPIPPSSAAHVSLSSLYAIVKEQTKSPNDPVKNNPTRQPPSSKSPQSRPTVSQETLERSSSSPAAPPPSSVIGLIDPTKRTSQHNTHMFFDNFVTDCFR